MILFIGLLIFTINVNAQFLQRFDKKPYTYDVDVALNKVKNNVLTADDFKAFLSRSLTFTVNETIYVLSYEEGTNVKSTMIKNEIGDGMYKTAQKTRNVFLYRRDANGWVKASDTIQTDYNNQLNLGLNPKTNSYDYAVLYSVLYNQTVENGPNGYGKVVKLENGGIMMLVPTSYGDTRINIDNVPFTYNKVVVFIPKGDGTYKVSIFKPTITDTFTPSLNVAIVPDLKVENGKLIYDRMQKLIQIR